MSKDDEEIKVPDNPAKKEEEPLEHLRKDHTIGEHRARIKEQVQDALEDKLFKIETEEPEKQFVQDDYISIRIALGKLRKERDMYQSLSEALKEVSNDFREDVEELRELKNKGRLYHLKKAFFP